MKTENLYAEGMIRTQSGIYYDIINPNPDMICLEDIHHALNRVPRFAGHTKHPWTVADHCVAMAMGEKEESNTMMLWLLMHDASEAYLGDIPGPLKRLLGGYAMLEERCMSAIAEKFGLEQGFWKDPMVKAADREALEREWDMLMLAGGRGLGRGIHWLRLAQKLLGA